MEEQQSPSMAEFGTSARRRIVIGDDDPGLLAMATGILRRAGYIVYATYNGFSTLQAATMVPNLDLLITNSRLGDVPAIELIRRVRLRKPDLAVLHIGAPLSADEPSLVDVPTLHEPFTRDQLLDSVRELLK
jgi:DNA-binding NtrC family response regulator